MKKKKILFAVLVLFLASLNLYAQTNLTDGFDRIDISLNGNWMEQESGDVMTLDNGIFDIILNDLASIRGAYTTDNGEISLTITHYFGGFFNIVVEAILLENRWYSIDDFTQSLGSLLKTFGVSEAEINMLINEFMEINHLPVMNYSINEDILIFSYYYDDVEMVDVFFRM